MFLLLTARIVRLRTTDDSIEIASFGSFHHCHSRFALHCPAASNAGLAHGIVPLLFNLKVYVVDFIIAPAKTLMKRLQYRNVIKGLRGRAWIVARRSNRVWENVDARRREHVLADSR